MSTIHNATRRGNIARVSELLRAGVKVNSRDQNGWTPLHHAAERGNVRMIRFLLNKGANARLKTNFNRTPLILATWENKLPAMRELLRHSNLNASDANAQTALALAVSNNRDPAGARMLLRAGAKVNENTIEMLTHNAAQHSNKWRNILTEMLVRRGAASRALSKMHTAMRARKTKARTGGNNTLAKTVFHPERVKRMMKQYGNNWLNRV